MYIVYFSLLYYNIAHIERGKNKMLIKRNEALAQEFISKYGNYGIERHKDIKDYIDELQKYSKECTAKGVIPSLEEFEEIYPNNPFDFTKRLNDSLKNEIIEVLNGYTQEMLLLIKELSSNHNLNSLINDQIIKNNSSISILICDMESGLIFNTLNEMDEPEKSRLLQLRESEEDIKEIEKLPPELRTLIMKSFYDDLSTDKDYFCIEHGLNSEEEFLVYLKATQNQQILELASDIRQDVSDDQTGFFTLVADAVDEMAHKALYKSIFIIPPYKN